MLILHCMSLNRGENVSDITIGLNLSEQRAGPGWWPKGPTSDSLTASPHQVNEDVRSILLR